MINFINRYVSKDLSIGSFLCSIPGLGFYRVSLICSIFGVKFKTGIYRCQSSKLEAIEKFIWRNYVVDSDLLREVTANLSTKAKSGSYQGIRLSQNLPSRGQRTKTNAKTAKSRRTPM
jgi:small subunit ribosomal protein S13